MLPDMDDVEITMADLWATGITPGGHRSSTCANGRSGSGRSRTASAGRSRPPGARGLAWSRTGSGTAGGVTFLNLEDETGMLNDLQRSVWRRYRSSPTAPPAW